jgi:hypothetical protein
MYLSVGYEEQREILFHASLNNNIVAFVRERTAPTERPPLIGEVSTNFYG